jgi:hypothetical protein
MGFRGGGSTTITNISTLGGATNPMRLNSWYGPTAPIVGGLSNNVQNRLLVAPFFVGRACHINKALLYVANSNPLQTNAFRIAIYADDGGYPGAVVLDQLIDVPNMAAGYLIVSVTSTSLPAGLYWAGAVDYKAAGIYTMSKASQNPEQTGPTGMGYFADPPTIPATVGAIGYALNGISGALPNPFSTPPADANNLSYFIFFLVSSVP